MNDKKNARKRFLKESEGPLGAIYDKLADLPSLELSELNPKTTALLVVDMINGFVKEGALASPNVLAINDAIAALSRACGTAGIRTVALCDSHPEDSPEFVSFPAHCVAGTAESEVTAEITAAAEAGGGLIRIEKGSTNGMLESQLKMWIDFSGCDAFIIVGDCTDLCVLQLATSLKAWFNTNGKTCRVIVPTELVATYDLGEHTAPLQNLFALYNMSLHGIELVRSISL